MSTLTAAAKMPIILPCSSVAKFLTYILGSRLTSFVGHLAKSGAGTILPYHF